MEGLNSLKILYYVKCPNTKIILRASKLYPNLMNDPSHSKQRNHMITAKHIAELTRLGTNLVWFGGLFGFFRLGSIVFISLTFILIMILTKRQINRHFGAQINLGI